MTTTDPTTTAPSNAITTRLADKTSPSDRAAILDGARVFAHVTDLHDILPNISSPAFEREVFRVLDLPQMVVLLAENPAGHVAGGIGMFITPYTWNTERLSAQEVFWWTHDDADPRAALQLLRHAVDGARAMGVSVLSLSALATSPPAVDTVYRRMGLRPAQTNWVGLLA